MKYKAEEVLKNLSKDEYILIKYSEYIAKLPKKEFINELINFRLVFKINNRTRMLYELYEPIIYNYRKNFKETERQKK